MLEVRAIDAGYGPVTVLHEVSIAVPEGAIVTIIGSNGAGKTTLLRAVSGILRPGRGSILLGRVSLPPVPHLVVNRGVVHVPEGRKVFPNLTVDENLLMGGYLDRSGRCLRSRMALMYERFPVLGQRRRQYAGTLSGGEQQMLAIARGLMSRPRVLMLDEPSLGLAPPVVQAVFSIIAGIREESTTVLLVEQNAGKVLGLADYGYVLETGRVVLEGKGPELLRNPMVKRAYLGETPEDVRLD